MNDTASNLSKGFDETADDQSLGELAYGVGFTLAALFLIILFSAASYLCSRFQPYNESSRRGTLVRPAQRQDYSVTIELGLDEATLGSYPKLPYSQAAKLQRKDSAATSCPICLADYRETHMLRLLPDCGHLFHLKCVDAWLRLNPTCPICRKSPLPTPMAIGDPSC